MGFFKVPFDQTIVYRINGVVRSFVPNVLGPVSPEDFVPRFPPENCPKSSSQELDRISTALAIRPHRVYVYPLSDRQRLNFLS